MANTSELIGLIIDLLPFLKSLTGERRRHFFEKVLEPLFRQFEEIHDHYNQIILNTRRDIAQLHAMHPPSLGIGAVLSRKAQEKLAIIKRDFENARMVDEDLRGSLRNESRDMLEKIRWQEERRFLVSFIYYFLDTGALAPTDDELDRAIAGIRRLGGDTYLGTPSMRLYLAINDRTELGQILFQLDESRDNLNQKHMNVRRCFRNVQMKVVLET